MNKNQSNKNELTTKEQEVMMKNWKVNEAGLDAIKKVSYSLSQESIKGIVKSIPILCKGRQCPYFKICPMEALDVDVDTLIDQRCPWEISLVKKKFDEYAEHFNINPDNVDIVVIGLVKQLIDYDIQLERASAIMSIDGHFLENVVVAVAKNGTPVYDKQISKAVDYKERITDKRAKILQLLNSTPKDKAAMKVASMADASIFASSLMKKADALDSEDIIEVENITVEGDKDE